MKLYDFLNKSLVGRKIKVWYRQRYTGSVKRMGFDGYWHEYYANKYWEDSPRDVGVQVDVEFVDIHPVPPLQGNEPHLLHFTIRVKTEKHGVVALADPGLSFRTLDIF